MVVGAFPFLKLGLLAIRQISRPIGNSFVENAKNHKFFRENVIIPIAQFYNVMEVILRLRALNILTPKNITPLSETKAIELGSTILGEAVVFFTGASILIFEYSRQSRKDAKKQKASAQEISEIKSSLINLNERIESNGQELTKLLFQLKELEKEFRNNQHKERNETNITFTFV